MAQSKPRLLLLSAITGAIAACGVSPEETGGRAISCALSGASDFASECRLVEMDEGAATYFVIHHPDGGFRKLALAETAAGFVEFDGSQPAESWREGDEVVLRIGEDRYRWEEPQDD